MEQSRDRSTGPGADGRGWVVSRVTLGRKPCSQMSGWEWEGDRVVVDSVGQAGQTTGSSQARPAADSLRVSLIPCLCRTCF